MNTFRHELSTNSPAETLAWAEQFAHSLTRGSTVALFGELGAGKTVIAKGIGRGLDIAEQILSPTFNYLLEYKGTRLPLYHADLYRIANSRAFEALGFLDYFESDGVFLIEWAERIADILPENTIRIELKRGVAENERTIVVTRGT